MLAAALTISLAGRPAAIASILQQSGPYRIEIATVPAAVPVGSATLLIRVADVSGRPVDGAQVSAVAQMPGMPMGERDEHAAPAAGQPGVYIAPARFAMAGGYNATIHVSGPQGAAVATIPISTGQNTGTLGAPSGAGTAGSGANLLNLVPWLLAGSLVLFVLYRMRRTGQRLNVRAALNPGAILGVLLLVAVYLVSAWAVRRFTQPAHVSVIEAQAMDMTAMKPPVGAVPVAAMAAKREPIGATVQYTGTAVAYDDQEITARVTGSIVEMTAYPGDRVHSGQVVARLDTSELASRVGEQEANVAMAGHDVEIARLQARQADAAADQAREQVRQARDDLSASQADLAGARQDQSASSDDRAAAQADLETAQTGVPDAAAQLSAVTADQRYWSAQIRRSTALLKSGAISQQEFDQDRAQADNADAKVRQAQAHVDQVNAAVRAARSRLAKSAAMAASAAARVRGLQAKVGAAQSHVADAAANARAMREAAAAADHLVEHRQAGEQMAMTQLHTQRVVEDYATVHAAIDGVVTQRLVSPGQLVQPGQAILRISREAPIRLQANVAPADLADVRIGSPVRAWSLRRTGAPVNVRVTAIFPSADPTARTSVVEATYPNADRRFVPGDFVTMVITTRQVRSALVVPASAIVRQPQATSDVAATQSSTAVWLLTAGTPEHTVYTCTMHPEVKSDRPGKCPT